MKNCFRSELLSKGKKITNCYNAIMVDADKMHVICVSIMRCARYIIIIPSKSGKQ